MFDFKKIEDFDRHIALSIPNYDGLVDTVKAVILEYLSNDGALLDIGCSSGALLNSLRDLTKANLIGCDLVDMGYDKGYDFHKKSARAIFDLFNIDDFDVISSIFTLQFMGRIERRETLKSIKNRVDAGSVFILAEKVHFNCSRLDTAIFRQHMRSKLTGFTAEEILAKDLQLSGSMFPRSCSEIEKELAEIGSHEVIWQCYNFKCWAVFGG